MGTVAAILPFNVVRRPDNGKRREPPSYEGKALMVFGRIIKLVVTITTSKVLTPLRVLMGFGLLCKAMEGAAGLIPSPKFRKFGLNYEQEKHK
jgi:hypothetical protein